MGQAFTIHFRTIAFCHLFRPSFCNDRKLKEPVEAPSPSLWTIVITTPVIFGVPARTQSLSCILKELDVVSHRLFPSVVFL
jgi:hypothetical protein